MSKSKPNAGLKTDIVVGNVAATKNHLIKNAIDDNLKEKFLADLRSEILSRHNNCIAVGIAHIRAIILCGELLLFAKSLVGHGNFNRWIEANFQADTGLSVRTAQRYIAKAKAFRKFLHSEGIKLDPNATTASFLDQDELLRQFANIPEFKSRLTQQTEEWGTPVEIQKAVQAVTSRIDCDPCASSHFNAADTDSGISFDKSADGLAENSRWIGNVYLAPGSRTNVVPWLTKANQQLQLGQIDSATALIPATFTPAVIDQLGQAVICILKKPLGVNAWRENNFMEIELSQPMAVVFLGPHKHAGNFATVFQTLGQVFWPHQSDKLRTIDGTAVRRSPEVPPPKRIANNKADTESATSD